MGLDFLDIHFRLEKMFKIRIGKEFGAVFERRGLANFAVRDVIEFVQSRVPPIHAKDTGSRDRLCVICRGYRPLLSRIPQIRVNRQML